MSRRKKARSTVEISDLADRYPPPQPHPPRPRKPFLAATFLLLLGWWVFLLLTALGVW